MQLNIELSFIKMKQQGYSLLEVLIALALLSLSLLGLAEGGLRGLQQDQMAYLNSLAGVQINNLAAELSACTCDNKICMQTAIARWQKVNAKLFPQANGKVSPQGKDYQLSIQWQLPGQGQVTAASAWLQIQS